MKAAFVGFGELGRQILGLAESLHKITDIVVFDDSAVIEREDVRRFPFKDAISGTFGEYSFFVCMGYRCLAVKGDLIRELGELGRELPSLVHPTSHIDPSARIGRAVYIYPMCNLDRNVVVDDGCLLNNSVTISHDGRLAECCYLSPSVTLSGYVTIGARTFLGTGVIAAHNVTIGAESRIGIGSVVTHDLPEGISAIGNPIRVLDKPLNLN